MKQPIRSVEKVIGPACIGHGSTSTLRLAPAKPARAVGPAADSAVARPRHACSAEEWEHGGSEHYDGATFGVFSPHGELFSLAGFEPWGERIISVVTAPEHRGRGYASAAVAAAAAAALEQGPIPL